LAVLASSPALAETETRILILNATDPYLPAYRAIDATMRETLAKDTTQHFAYFSETLDGQRFDWKQYEAEFLALLVKKYERLRIDVVVAITQPALDFANDYGRQLWPGASIVFHAISARKLNKAALPARVTGVVNPEDVDGTLDLAQRLQPHARRILVIAGVSELDQNLADVTRKALATRPQTAEVEFLIGQSQPDILERVKRETADTIVLLLTQYRDLQGRPYTPAALAHAIGAVSAAPVYGLYETYVGYGVRVGRESYAGPGRLVAERIRQVAAGIFAHPGCGHCPRSLHNGCLHCVVGLWMRENYPKAAKFASPSGRSGASILAEPEARLP
jgi:hypothetical protein